MHSITLTLTYDLLRRGRWGLLLGALAGNALPVLLLTIFIQKEIVTGMTAGSIKGG